MKRGLSFGFVSLVIVFVLAIFLVSGFSFKTFTGKITGNAVSEEYVIITWGQTGTATCGTERTCSGIFYYPEGGELTSDNTYSCSNVITPGLGTYETRYAYCVPVSSGTGDNSGSKITAPSTTCDNKGTQIGQIEIGTGSAEWLCTNYNNQLVNLDCRSSLVSNVYVPSTHANVKANGWTCGKWGWECGGKGYNSGYCCNGVNQQTPCFAITSITPSFGAAGTTVTILGNNFGPAGQNNINGEVEFIKPGEIDNTVRIDKWDEKNNIIEFQVPSSLKSGVYSIRITTSTGTALKENAFTITNQNALANLKSCENYYNATWWPSYLPTYDASLLVACDNVQANCFNKNEAVYNGKCYLSTIYKADFHRTVQKNVGFTDGNDKIALTYNINGNPDPVYYGKWIGCDTTAEHCTACDNEIPTSWTTSVNKNLDTSNNVGGITNCTGAQCWVKSGETSVGEYKSQTQAGCCGDDPNEYFITTNGKSACCNAVDDIVNADGQCLVAGTITNKINPNLDCTCAIYDFVKNADNKAIVDIEDTKLVLSCITNPSATGCSLKRMDINNDGKITQDDLDLMNSCNGASKLLSSDCDYEKINCEGCILGSNCIKAGTRATLGNSARYCNINNHWLTPKVDNVACSNDYECTTNVCVDGKCLSIKKELEKQTGLLKQIWCWLQHPLSATERQKCYAAS